MILSAPTYAVYGVVIIGTRLQENVFLSIQYRYRVANPLFGFLISCPANPIRRFFYPILFPNIGHTNIVVDKPIYDLNIIPITAVFLKLSYSVNKNMKNLTQEDSARRNPIDVRHRYACPVRHICCCFAYKTLNNFQLCSL